MNYKLMGRLNAMILAAEAVFMIPAFAVCVYDKDLTAAKAFAVTAAAALAMAGVLALLSKGAKKGFYAKEGFVCVALSWIMMSLIGCVPFILSGAIPGFIDALFEIVSGFTTTGASILLSVEELPRGILYWRSFSHWVGGMGVLVFILAVVPVSGRDEGFSMHLMRAESPGPDVGKLVSRTRQTAMILYILYIVLTLLNVIFLLFGKMPLFEALCTAFGTAGTGGFGVKNNSIAGYSTYIQNVCTVFMILFGVNFNCYFLLIIGHIKSVFKNEELRLYIFTFLASTALIAYNIRAIYPTLEETLRHAAFQVSSIMTTTGFATTDFNMWPNFSKSVLLILMVIGACAGSTGGGIKCARILLLFKSLKRSIGKLLHPKKIQNVIINGQSVDEKIIGNTSAYLFAYVLIVCVSFAVISIDGFSLVTNLSAVLACFNNIGPGLELVGPTANYSGFGDFSKTVLIVDMLAGRLEIFPILVLISPSTWKRA